MRFRFSPLFQELGKVNLNLKRVEFELLLHRIFPMSTVTVVSWKMHFRFARQTSGAIRYYPLSRQMSRGVLNFRNTHRRNGATSGKTFRLFGEHALPEDVSRNPNRPRDHLLSARERPTAKTLVIAAFIFGACPCAIRRHIYIAIPRSLWSRRSYLLDAYNMQGRGALLRISALETTRSM